MYEQVKGSRFVVCSRIVELVLLLLWLGVGKFNRGVFLIKEVFGHHKKLVDARRLQDHTCTLNVQNRSFHTKKCADAVHLRPRPNTSLGYRPTEFGYARLT